MSMVDVQIRRGAGQINRENRRTSLAIVANLADDKTNQDAQRAMTEVLSKVTFPPGYGFSFGGDFQRNDEAGQQMAINTIIAIIMIFIVMAALFESLLYPMAIMSSIVFSAFGVFWFFVITNTTFTVMAAIGILVLMGVVVNNGIVMLEHINNLRREGHARIDALVEGSRERLRPILMTMGTTILGMIPLTLGTTQIGGDGPGYYPMARAIVGGLIFRRSSAWSSCPRSTRSSTTSGTGAGRRSVAPASVPGCARSARPSRSARGCGRCRAPPTCGW